MNTIALQQEIFEKAHLNESSELARAYWKESGLKFKDIRLSHLYKLREMILDEIYPLLADKTYSMVNELTMDNQIKTKFNKKELIEAELYTNGYYFKKREAVTFDSWITPNKEQVEFIGLCGWASGCNRIPYIKGFIKWINWLCEELNKERI